jgi:hypothetical protein
MPRGNKLTTENTEKKRETAKDTKGAKKADDCPTISQDGSL